MKILVPTRGRVKDQLTISNLPDFLRRETVLFCPRDEAWRHRGDPVCAGVSVVEQPDDITTIAKKRAWMMQYADQKGWLRVLMLDDDLRFFVRRDDVPDRLRYAADEDFVRWFGELADRLTPDTPHAGFGPRQGNNNAEPGWHVPGRMMFALGYYVPVALAEAEWGRIGTREDMDVCLQLLRKGYPNSVCHSFVVDQRGYAGKGGCSSERTKDSSNHDAHRLADLHPGYVAAQWREYKDSSQNRFEVTCRWKKALDERDLYDSRALRSVPASGGA